MALIPLSQPYSLKTSTLIVEADDFTQAVSGVVLTPSSSSTSWRGIGGNTISDQSMSDWKLKVSAAADLAPGGLQRYLLDNEGEERTIVFVPKAGGPSLTVTVKLVPGQFGGAADGNISTFDTEMPVTGRPVFDDDYTPPVIP